jgi:molecular chaperone GrpE (heat shock protein)
MSKNRKWKKRMRHVELEWAQSMARILDHAFALHSAAGKSNLPNVVEQISHFKNVCLQSARALGLRPFVSRANVLFNPNRHHISDKNGGVAPGVRLAETVAPGYTFRGKVLRPAVVRLADPVAGAD